MNTITRAKTRSRKTKSRGKPDAVGQYASDAWSLAKRTASGLNEIRKLINIETKFLDTQQSSTTISTTGTVFPVSEIAQGLTSTTRVGDSIRLQHFELRGRCTISATANTSLLRLLVVRDLDGYGTAPTVTDILETATPAVSAPLAPYRFNKRQRFSILFDELFGLVGSAAYDGNSEEVFSFMTSHQGHILYLGATAAAASDGKGSVYVVAVSDEGTNTPSIAFTSRILFTDD